jgi:hypothetical protein
MARDSHFTDHADYWVLVFTRASDEFSYRV